MNIKYGNTIIRVKNIENNSHGSLYNRASTNLSADKTYWSLALRMSVLVSTLDAGSSKRRICVEVESFCSRNL